MGPKLRLIVALVLGLLSLAGRDRAASAFDRIGPRPVVIGDVAYLPGMETRREGEAAVFVRATIRAVDVRTDRELWSIRLREDAGPDGLAVESKESAIRVMTRFSQGFLALTQTGLYFVDPTARTSRPVMDHRLTNKECEVHHRGLEEYVIPIHYGLGIVLDGRPEDRARLFPNAMTVVNAGCLVREARIAAVHYCPACREAARASMIRPAEPAK